jgi:hypothetical protein
VRDRVIRLGFCKVILTSKDYVFWDGEWVKLSDELGWWTSDGEIYMYLPGVETLRERIGVTTHEVVEYVLEKKLGFEHRKAHKIANIVEKAVSLGKAKLY